jgi:tetratricopeptide (TPR) repeat protein
VVGVLAVFAYSGNFKTRSRVQINDNAVNAWLEKAVSVFDADTDAKGAIRLGWKVDQPGEFPRAAKLYRQALKIAHQAGDLEQEADSYAFLGALDCEQRDCGAAITWYEEGRIRDNGRDFPSVKRWFRKAIEIDPAMAWRDRFTLFARLWRYRLFDAFMS